LHDALPIFKSLNSGVICQSKIAVMLSSFFIAFLSTDPEFSEVFPLEQYTIFLTLVEENCFSFSKDLIRAHRHCHVYFMNFPFVPSSSVEPQPTIIHIGLRF